jgi:type II secretory pathway pseudopilin PulG
MIMCAGVPCKLSVRGLVVIGLLALAALPSWSPGQQETEKPKAPVAPVAVPPAPTPELAPSQPPPAPPVAEVPPPAIQAVPYSAFAGFSIPNQNDSDTRLKAIEQQLHALLKEVQGMRKGGAAKAATPPTPYSQYVPPVTITAVPATASVGQAPFPTSSTRAGDGAISLTRAIYDLPAAKAKALSDLLQDSKGPVVEIKADGDKVTVTTTPEAQQMIGQLIAMLQGKTRVHVPRTTYQYIATPVTTYEAVPAAR